MKKLIAAFVKNSILVNFLTVFIIAVGVMSIISIKKELRPEVSIDKVVITTTYTGASPVEMEKLVTIPIEETLASVYGIDSIESLSYTGMSQITVDIDPDNNDKSSVIQEIFRSVSNIKDLPDEAEDPRVRELKSKAIPVYGVAIYGDVDDFTMKKWVEKLEDELEQLSLVSSADIGGLSDPTINVVVDPKKLQKHSISVEEIMNSIKSWNRSAPAGYVRNNGKEIPVRLAEDLDELKKISKLIVRTNDMGKGVSIRDVAVVKWGFKNNRKIDRYNGTKNVQIDITKKENADTIKTVDSIKKAIAKFNTKLPTQIKTLEFRDESSKIKLKLNSVYQNAIIGLVLVVAILLLMLNWRIALVTALGLPVAFFGSIWALSMMGYTLNTMTIIGIILVIGMLVDDGIVVAENIFYHYEKGQNKIDAAIDGSYEIITPVIGTVLTTIVAFLPLVFMSGIIGKFLSVIPVAVITCLVFSLIECTMILPNHAAEFMGHGKSGVANFLNNLLEKIYKPLLNTTVTHRWKVIPVILTLVITLFLYFVAGFKMQMFPSKGVTSFSMNIQGPANTRIERTDEIVKSMEKAVQKHINKYITGYKSKIGSLDGRRGLSYEGTNTAGFTLFLMDEDDLDKDPLEIVKMLRQEIKPLVPDKWILSFEVKRHGPPMGKAVEIEITHDDYRVMNEVSKLIQTKLKTIRGSSDIQDDLLTGFKEYVLKINQKKAVILGVDPSTLQRTSMSAFEGIPATKVRKLDDEYDVRVIYPDSYRDDINNLLQLKIKTKYNTYVSLSMLASLELVDSVGSIKHSNQKRTVSVMASLKGRKVTAYEINKKMTKYVESEITPKYPNTQIHFGGEEEKRKEMMGELIQLFVIALLGVYMILSLVFRSVFYPFFVVLMIPFGFVGALSALQFYGEIVSLPGMISFVGLTGVVINDAIILVIYIRGRYQKTKDMAKSVIEGGLRRLRPIFITTVTTFFGLLPAIYELGGQDANMKPMAIVIAWGLVLSTIMTMLFIPGFMACLHDIGRFFMKKDSK